MRDPDEARKEFELLEGVMAEVESCQYGLWTNGLEFFFFEKEVTRFDTKFKPIGDWPMGDDTIGTRDVASIAKMRRADPEMLRTAFRRCHNLHPRQRGDAEGCRLLAIPLPDLLQDVRRAQARRASRLLGGPLRAV